VTTDPDRRMRIPHRPGVRSDPLGAEMRALEGDVVGCPNGPDHVECLVEQRGALLEVHPERGELSLEVADADRKGESAAREQVQCRARLGHYERVSVRQYHDVRNEPQRGGPGRGVSHRDERVQRIVSARFEPALTGRRVVGEPEAVDTGGLGGCRHLGDPVAGDQFRVVWVAVHRVGDGEFHLPLSLAERRRRACKIPRDIYTIICKAGRATGWSVSPPQKERRSWASGPRARKRPSLAPPRPSTTSSPTRRTGPRPIPAARTSRTCPGNCRSRWATPGKSPGPTAIGFLPGIWRSPPGPSCGCSVPLGPLAMTATATAAWRDASRSSISSAG